MNIEQTKLEGCYLIEPNVFKDERGSFFESFNKKKFEKKINLKVNFVQDNQSQSNRGVIRGLHFQKGNYAQAKLVRVIKGKILDVVVDIRKESNTFGEIFTCILSEENHKQIFVPRGFAHGFSVLEDNTIVHYKCDNFYNKEAESGIIYNDLELNINWKLDEKEIVLSKKDTELKTFKEFKK